MQTFRMAQSLFERLHRHLFPGDHDEHGAVVLAGVVETERGVRFLARDVVLARDGIDYVPGSRGYRALTADFVARVSDRCAREKLCYFAVHCHGGRDRVSFSPDDMASHRRGYPALLDITCGGPVGALVFAENAVAGEVWRPIGVTPLDAMTVVGANLQHLHPSLSPRSAHCDPLYDRQSRLFGESGQMALRQAKVGIIGLGGVGSLVSQWLAHLGVGHIVGVDYDKLEFHNRPRVVGSRPWDAGEPFARSRFQVLRRLGGRLAKPKVQIAKRTARHANTMLRYDALVGNVTDLAIARHLVDADYLFLCADSMQARLVFNAIVHQYLIPGVQIGVKVPVEKASGLIQQVFVASRRIQPQAGDGCLLCNGLIPADKLREECTSAEQRRQQRYVTDEAIVVPSVITLNALGAAQAVDDFLFTSLGLLEPTAKSGYVMHYPRERAWSSVACSCEDACLHCGPSPRSAYGRGDRSELPCRS